MSNTVLFSTCCETSHAVDVAGIDVSPAERGGPHIGRNGKGACEGSISGQIQGRIPNPFKGETWAWGSRINEG